MLNALTKALLFIVVWTVLEDSAFGNVNVAQKIKTVKKPKEEPEEEKPREEMTCEEKEYENIKGMWYKTYLSENRGQMTYESCKAKCINDGNAYMMEPRTQQMTDDFLEAFPGLGSFWLGMTQIDQFVYKWCLDDEIHVTPTGHMTADYVDVYGDPLFANWYFSNTDCYNISAYDVLDDAGRDHKECVSFSSLHMGGWMEADCEEYHMCVCECVPGGWD